MRKFLGKRGFAVFTSLALCASLVAPSFAATFMDLQHAINGTYTGGAFTVTSDENGRTIKLNENVERGEAESSNAVGFGNARGQNLTLDLNGHDIDANGGKGVLNVSSTVNLTIKDSTAQYDENGNQTYAGHGKITGGNVGKGGGVSISGDAKVTLESGNITGNTSSDSGGGVGVSGSNASFTMTGGVISGNTAANSAGDGGGGGVWVKSGATFTMKGGTITGNTVGNGNSGNGGGVAIHQANFEMSGGSIYDNESARGTGVLINAGYDKGGNASFTMTGGYVSGKDDTSCIFLEEKNGKDAVFELSGDGVMNGSIRLGDGTQVITDSVVQPGGNHHYTGFDVIDENGGELGSVETEETESSTTGGNGYEAKGETFLDINYDHEYWSVGEEHWSDNGDGTHSNLCKYCNEKEPAIATPHSWGSGEVTTPPTATEAGERTFTCQGCGATKTESIPATGVDDSGEIEIPDVEPPLADLPDFGDEIEIDEPEVPLAGLLTRADVIGYLWEQAGSPDAELSDFPDVPADHERAVAIGWAQDVGIALPDLEGSFRPDDLVLRSVEDIQLNPEGELEQFLNRYAVYAGIVLEPGELFITLEGEPDDIIMGEDAQAIFDDFFVKLEFALAQAA